MKKTFLAAALLIVSAMAAKAQVPDLNSLIPQGSGTVSSRIIQIVALLTVLSVAPGLLVMVTSFTRFAVALSFLRSGLRFAKHARKFDSYKFIFVHDVLCHGADIRARLG